MNRAIKKHLESEIKALQNAPRDPEKLERLLKVKERENEEARYARNQAFCKYRIHPVSVGFPDKNLGNGVICIYIIRLYYTYAI
jgi:hypothetical protein